MISRENLIRELKENALRKA